MGVAVINTTEEPKEEKNPPKMPEKEYCQRRVCQKEKIEGEMGYHALFEKKTD